MRNLVFSLLAIFVITGLLATPANATTKKPWTFMVFLNADNNLEGAGIKDFNEMEQTGSNSNMNVIVQMDRCSGYDYSNGNWTDTRRYYVTKDNDMRTIHSKLLQDMGELNMGDPNVLVNFVKFCADNYPAEHYALVVWNHGGGWKHRNKAQMKVFRGVSYDSTDNDHITMPEMKSAMNSVASYLGQKLDVLDYDACLMGMVEVAYQIKDTVGYLAGSEETEPGDGNPYDLILPTINANTTGAELATIIAKAYQQSYESGYSSTTKAADDLSQMNNVGEAINAVATLMKDNMSTLKPSITSALNNAQKFYDKDYVDFVSLLSGINTSDSTLQSKINAAISAVKKAVIYNGHTGSSMSNAHGLSIYFPSSSYSYISRYDNLTFSRDTGWNEFLAAYYNTTSSSNGGNNNNGGSNDNGGGWWPWFSSALSLNADKVKAMNTGRLSETNLNIIMERQDALQAQAANRIQNALQNNNFNVIKGFVNAYSKLTPAQKKAVMPMIMEIRSQLAVAAMRGDLAKINLQKMN
jgi:hypothetical protein